MKEMIAGHAIVEVLKAEGVRCVFGIPGGHVLAIYDGLYDAPEIRHFLVRHEQSAANMAAAYAQLTGEAAVCLATAGPGATNLVSGVAEAHVGALPMVILAGRGSTTTAQRGASQEIDTHEIFRPITKWSVRVDRADLLVDVLRQAFVIARNGRPGPVYVDIPRDLLGEQVKFGPYIPAGAPARPGADEDRIAAAAEALIGAKRPIIVAGGGAVASGAFAELRELAESLAIPVLTTLAGRGIIPDDHPLSVGGLGAHRNPLSKRLLGEADVVLGLGARFEEMETNWRPGSVPSPQARYIQVDINAAEIGRSVPAVIGVVGDARRAAADILAIIRGAGKALSAGQYKNHPRVKKCAGELVKIIADVDAAAENARRPIHPLQVIRAVRRAFPRETTVAIDVGCLAQHMVGSAVVFPVFEPRSLIVPSSFYGMGFAASALPVAQIVYPNRPAVGFVGDGSFQMIMNVLPVAAEYRLPVTWCVLNDNGLGSIRDIQQLGMGNRVLDTSFKVQPDFARVAEACGCFGERVEDPNAVEAAIAHALEENRNGVPAVLDFAVASERMQQTYEHYAFYGKA